MERFNALGRGMQIMLVAGALLFIDLFLRWQEVEFDLGPLGEGSAGVSAWDNFLGIVLGLLVIALLVWIVLRIAAVDIPIPVSPVMVAALLGGLIAVVALLKNLVDDYSTIWSYIGVVLAILIAVGAWMMVQGAGGVDTLKSEATSMRSSSGSEMSPAASSPPPPPPAAPESEAAPAPAESPPMSEPEPYEPPSDDPETRRDA